MFVYSCGIIFDVCELYGSESASQVYSRLVKLVMELPDKVMPNLMFYDDGCGLRKFAELRAGVNAIARRVWEKIARRVVVHSLSNSLALTLKLASRVPSHRNIFVDRLHWKNHKKTDNNRYCWENCDPGLLGDAAKGIDTERCEQTFSWLARYKHTARYMRPGHFLFFMLVLCDMKNSERCAMSEPSVKRQY